MPLRWAGTVIVPELCWFTLSSKDFDTVQYVSLLHLTALQNLIKEPVLAVADTKQSPPVHSLTRSFQTQGFFCCVLLLFVWILFWVGCCGLFIFGFCCLKELLYITVSSLTKLRFYVTELKWLLPTPCRCSKTNTLATGKPFWGMPWMCLRRDEQKRRSGRARHVLPLDRPLSATYQMQQPLRWLQHLLSSNSLLQVWVHSSYRLLVLQQ